MTAVAPPVEHVAPKLVTRVHEGALAGPARLLLAGGAVLVVASAAIGYFTDWTRFLHGYLVAYMWGLGIVLGGLIFVLLQHLARAGWSVVVRRIAEHVATVVPLMALLFVPIALGLHQLYHHWVDMDAHPEDLVLQGKKAYLNQGFWYLRAGIYFVIWIGVAAYFKRASLAQDQSGDPRITLRLARIAAPATLLFALSITFAAFDWIMSLDPHWFSTIFGVCYFAGGFMAFMATLALLCMYLGRQGYLKEAVTTEHYHDMGKLLFAFMVFWTYVNFSQYMLIWYANLPEETAFYAHRKEGNWQWVGAALVFGHFLAPFAFLMSRHIKRNRLTLAVAAVFMLVMHWVDMAFLILPNWHPTGEGHHEPGLHLHVLDVTSVLGVAAVILGATLVGLRKTPLVPERDPRLAESLHFNNI
ncbi:MAG: hypothetical protein R3F56_22225 [Planctomycetota bacterium]